MVVVAIIAILSTIAIPSFQVFQAKARQKEGFALLGAYFNAASASRIEYGFFPGELPATGFAPTGMLGYRLTAADNGVNVLPYMQMEYNTCIATNSAAANCPPNYTSEWQENPLGVLNTSLGVGATTGASMAAATTFIVHAAGWISLKAATVDEYSIDQLKSLSAVSDGLK